MAPGCSDQAVPVQPRGDRLAIFRDLILYERHPSQGGAFFLDRFETTRQDWFRYRQAMAASAGEAGGAAPAPPTPPVQGTENLPAVRISLFSARAYASWRYCRLPSYGEWHYAATGGGSYEYPWGSRYDARRANTWDLGLDEPTPVGTFESGREEGGAYDLFGNVAEWTESVAQRWFIGSNMPRHRHGLPLLWGTPAMRLWMNPGVPAAGYWMIQAWGRDFPRLVVGGHFRSVGVDRGLTVPGARPMDGLGWLWERGAGERGDTVGIRLAADPQGLLTALLREPTAHSGEELEPLRSFLRVDRHRRVLRLALPRALASVPDGGPLQPVLLDELDGGELGG